MRRMWEMAGGAFWRSYTYDFLRSTSRRTGAGRGNGMSGISIIRPYSVSSIAWETLKKIFRPQEHITDSKHRLADVGFVVVHVRLASA